MYEKNLQDERTWMTVRLAATGMSSYERYKAAAMVHRGVLIGDVLSRLWKRVVGR